MLFIKLAFKEHENYCTVLNGVYNGKAIPELLYIIINLFNWSELNQCDLFSV